MLFRSKVEQYATPQEIYDRPATPFVAEFVGQGNWLPFSRNSASHAQVGGMNMRLADDAGVARSGRLFCRPEAISVNPPVHEENLFPAKVREITFLGNRCRMSFELEQLPGHPLPAPSALPPPSNRVAPSSRVSRTCWSSSSRFRRGRRRLGLSA